MPKRLFFVVFFMLFTLTLAHAYDIEMTDTEWMTWPEYCKTRYTELGAAKNRRFLKYYSSSLRDKWIKKLGYQNYRGVQHYCAGRIWLQRANNENDQRKRNRAYRRAIEEFSFQYDKQKYSFPYFSNLAAYMAQAYYAIGNIDKAIAILEYTIKKIPKGSAAYAELANIYRREGRFDESLSVLNDGLENVGENSVNIHLYLAHVYIDVKNYEKAKYHTSKTYQLGYPLPGLKRRLQYMKDENTNVKQ